MRPSGIENIYSENLNDERELGVPDSVMIPPEPEAKQELHLPGFWSPSEEPAPNMAMRTRVAGPRFIPVDYDPFDTKVMGKFDDRVPQGNPSSPVLALPAPLEAPNLSNIPAPMPQAPPAAQIQRRYPPSDTLFAPRVSGPAISEKAMQELVALLQKYGLTGLLGGTSLADLAQPSKQP